MSFVLRRLVKPTSLGGYHLMLTRKAVHWSTSLLPARFTARFRLVDGSPVRGEWAEPLGSAACDRVLLYLHGGGYVACSPRTHRSLTGALASASGSSVFALRYRLAPENPYPAALEDAVAAYRWLLSRGTRPERLVVVGDSAGGGLALAMLTALREAGGPMPAAVICFSPWTDLAATGPSLIHNEDRCAMFFGDTIRKTAPLYLSGVDPRTPLASPLYADLRGLPPLLVHVSDSEVLLDDSLRLVERAEQAGLKVQLRVWPDQPHVWQLFGALPEARDSISQAVTFIEAHAPSRRAWAWPVYAMP